VALSRKTSTTALALTRTALMEPETGSTIPHQKTGPSGRNELWLWIMWRDNFFYKLKPSKKCLLVVHFRKLLTVYSRTKKTEQCNQAIQLPTLPRAPLSCMSLGIFAQLAAHPPLVLRAVQHEVEAPRASDLRPPVLLSSRDHVGPTPSFVTTHNVSAAPVWRYL
jgi:hypothetical protein